MFTFKKKNYKYDLIEFSMMDISTGQIGEYIIKELYENNYFKDIGYTYSNKGYGLRCTLHTLNPPNKKLVQYFKDRCSAMVEHEVKKYDGISHSWINHGGVELVKK